MNIDRSRLGLFVALLGIPLVSGCSMDPRTGEVRPSPPQLGEASQQTMLAQIIDPEPEYTTLVPESSGDHAQQAIERYNTDSVKETETMTVGGSGGGGSRGGGGTGGTPGS